MNLFVASARLGATPVPGCLGLTLPLQRPRIVGMAASQGGTASTTVSVPSGLAGRSYAFVAVDLAGCRISDLQLTTF